MCQAFSDSECQEWLQRLQLQLGGAFTWATEETEDSSPCGALGVSPHLCLSLTAPDSRMALQSTVSAIKLKPF